MPIGNSVRHYAFTAGRCVKLLAIDAFTPSGRQRFRSVSDLFGWRTFPGRVGPVDPSEVIPPQTEALVTHLEELSYNVGAYELGLLCQLARVRRPQAIFEFGTFDGRSTVNMAINAPQARLTTFDLPVEQAMLSDGAQIGQRFVSHPASERIQQVHGNSLEYDFSQFRRQFDFVFIDAGHSYENCASDTRSAFNLLREEGPVTVLWHDYTRFPGVTRAVDEAQERHSAPGRFLHLRHTSLAVYLRD